MQGPHPVVVETVVLPQLVVFPLDDGQKVSAAGVGASVVEQLVAVSAAEPSDSTQRDWLTARSVS